MAHKTDQSAHVYAKAGRGDAEPIRAHADVPGSRQGCTQGRKLGVLLSVLMAMMIVFGALPQQAFADDFTHTVPNDENYSSTITTILAGNDGSTTRTAAGVVQSQSTTSATTFASGMPLSTIYIDQSKVTENGGTFKVLATNAEFAAGIELGTDNTVTYNPKAAQGLKQLEPNKINELQGDLFSFTFTDAAILPNGNTANLRIIYSDAKIGIDERYLDLSGNSYNGAVWLARGKSFAYGGTDSCDFSNPTYKENAEKRVQTTVKKYSPNDSFESKKNKVWAYPIVGLSLDATYQIVDNNGIPVNGTFVYAITGLNIDRDPHRGSSNNGLSSFIVGKSIFTY